MDIGVGFPQLDLALEPAAIRDFAQAVEALGFTHLMLGDHILGEDPATFQGPRGPYPIDYLWHEPFSLFSFLASITTRLSFLLGVLVLPQRQTALVAKQAAQLDFLSGGRLRLGVGVGWSGPEYAALGAEFANRGSRMEEQFAVLRALWTQPLVTFHGRWHHIEGMGLNPRPVQQPIPIWIGGSAEAALRRTGQLADGWIAHWDPFAGIPQTPENVRGALAKIRAYAAAAGREPGAVGLQGIMSLRPGTTPDQWRATVEEWRGLGATHLQVGTRGHPASPDAHVAALRRFTEEVGLA